MKGTGVFSSLSDVIEKARTLALTDVDVLPLCATDGMSPSEFCDDVALELTHGYLAGDIDWRSADAAMTHVQEWAYRENGPGLSNLAWIVYSAFVLLEDRHDGQPADAAADYFCLPLLQLAQRTSQGRRHHPTSRYT